jgi:hypothetical protein
MSNCFGDDEIFTRRGREVIYLCWSFQMPELRLDIRKKCQGGLVSKSSLRRCSFK